LLYLIGPPCIINQSWLEFLGSLSAVLCARARAPWSRKPNMYRFWADTKSCQDISCLVTCIMEKVVCIQCMWVLYWRVLCNHPYLFYLAFCCSTMYVTFL